MTGRAWVGCSGWIYREWRGVVYPAGSPPRRWFGHYAERFDTVELNATFYRLPAVATVERWRQQAPAGFTYAVKVGAFGSHRKKLRDPAGWLPNHLDRVERLGPHLGPQLVQLPPRWRRNAERLDQFLAAVPSGLRWAVELRDPSWLHDEVFGVLARHGAALCLHDLLAGHPWELTAGRPPGPVGPGHRFTYVRFHGPDARRRPYTGRYGPRRLGPVAERLGRWLDEGWDVYAYFNNDVGAAAVADATWLRRALDGGGSGS